MSRDGLTTATIEICHNPVFVIGSPRSVTSGFAWALAHHPDFHAFGEIEFMHDLYGDNHQDNINVLDLRIEKSVKLGSAARVRLFGDIFNIFNAYAAETITVSTGASFLQPTAILGPRTARIGARLIW